MLISLFSTKQLCLGTQIINYLCASLDSFILYYKQQNDQQLLTISNCCASLHITSVYSHIFILSYQANLIIQKPKNSGSITIVWLVILFKKQQRSVVFTFRLFYHIKDMYNVCNSSKKKGGGMKSENAKIETSLRSPLSSY